MSRMSHRIAALEKRTGPQEEPVDSFLISFSHLDEQGELVTDVGAATVFGSASKQGLELQRGAEESEAEFLARVDAERVRIHGSRVLAHD